MRHVRWIIFFYPVSLFAIDIVPAQWWKVLTQPAMVGESSDRTLLNESPYKLFSLQAEEAIKTNNGSFTIPLMDKPVTIAIRPVPDPGKPTYIVREWSELLNAVHHIKDRDQCDDSTPVVKIRFDSDISASLSASTDHLSISKKCRAILDGDGHTLTLQDPTKMGINIAQSSQIEIRNLRIRYDYPADYKSPGFLGKIGLYWEDGNPIKVVRLQNTQLPPRFERNFYLLSSFGANSDWTNGYNNVARTFLCSEQLHGEAGCQKVKSNRGKLDTYLAQETPSREVLPAGTYYSSALQNAKFSVGEPVILLHKRGGYQTALAINGSKSEDITLDGVTVLSAPNMAIRAMGGRGLWIKNSKIKRDTNDPVAGMLSARADGIHIAGMKGDIVIENNLVRDQGDDGLNVRGINVSVSKYNVQNSTLTIGTDTIGEVRSLLEEGDILAVLKSDMAIAGFLQISNLPKDPKMNPYTVTASDYSPSLKVLSHLAESGIRSFRTFVITKASSRYLVRNNTFSNNHGRGIISHSPNGRITANTIKNTLWSGAYLMVDNGFFKNGPSPTNVSFDQNTFEHTNNWKAIGTTPPASLMIFLNVEKGGTNSSSLPYHGHVRVSHNHFKDIKGPAIIVARTQGVKIEGNDFTNVNYSPSNFTSEPTWRPKGTVYLLDAQNIFINLTDKNICKWNCRTEFGNRMIQSEITPPR